MLTPPSPTLEKHRVEIPAQFVEREIAAEGEAVFHLDAADRKYEGCFLGREVVRGLVRGDTVFVEPGGLLARLEDGRVMARDRERVRAREAGRSGADDRDALAGRRPTDKGLLPRRHLRIDRVTLKQADANRLALGVLAHARLLAQRFGRTDPRAHPAHDVGFQNCARRAERVVRGDLADEERNVDRGRAGLLTRRIETEIAAVGLDVRLVKAQRRMQVGEVGVQARGVEPARRDVGHSRGLGDDGHDGSY